MKKDLLNILVCPNCKNSNLSVKINEIKRENIIDGVISCTSCLAKFEIKDSIPSFLSNADRAVYEEKTAIARIKESQENVGTRDVSPLKKIDFEQMLKLNFKSVKNKFNPKNGDRILDIGTGDGWMIVDLASEGYKCIGIDICKDFTKVFKSGERVKENIELLLADMNNTPFVDETFDIISISGVMHHSYNMNKTIKEIRRLLKYGGRICVINEPIAGLFKIGSWSSRAFPSVTHRSYSIFTYLNRFRKVGLRPEVLFPGYVDEKLLKKDLSYARFKILARVVSIFWQIPAFRKWLKKYGLFPALVLFGIPLTMIAKKVRR